MSPIEICSCDPLVSQQVEMSTRGGTRHYCNICGKDLPMTDKPIDPNPVPFIDPDPTPIYTESAGEGLVIEGTDPNARVVGDLFETPDSDLKAKWMQHFDKATSAMLAAAIAAPEDLVAHVMRLEEGLDPFHCHVLGAAVGLLYQSRGLENTKQILAGLLALCDSLPDTALNESGG